MDEAAEWDCFKFYGVEAECEARYPEDDGIRVLIAEHRTEEYEPFGLRVSDVMRWFIRNNLRIGAMHFQTVRLMEETLGLEAVVRAGTISQMAYDGMEEIVAGRDDEMFSAGTYMLVNNFEIERSVRGNGFGVLAVNALCSEIHTPESELSDLLWDTKAILVRPYSDLSLISESFAEFLLAELQDAIGEPEGILLSTVPD
jgi:hypothetical protein